MSRLYMLDTNTVVYILKAKSPAARGRLASLPVGEVVCVSAVTEGELRYGLEKAGTGAERKRSLEQFLARLKVFAWGAEEAAIYGELRVRQEASGRALGPLDALIAAHAIAVKAILVTNDKALQRVTGLTGVENWATDL